jgi:hypothetical protein
MDTLIAERSSRLLSSIQYVLSSGSTYPTITQILRWVRISLTKAIRMKILASLLIFLSILFLALAMAEAIFHFYVMNVAPFSFIVLSGSLSLFTTSLMLFDRIYLRKDPKP